MVCRFTEKGNHTALSCFAVSFLSLLVVCFLGAKQQHDASTSSPRPKPVPLIPIYASIPPNAKNILTMIRRPPCRKSIPHARLAAPLQAKPICSTKVEAKVCSFILLVLNIPKRLALFIVIHDVLPQLQGGSCPITKLSHASTPRFLQSIHPTTYFELYCYSYE